MKKIILVFSMLTCLSFGSLSQNLGEKAVQYLTECSCREVVMVSRGVEKTYSATWLEGIVLEDGFIIFSKGETKHRWNPEKITFIEKGNGFIRIYLD